MSDIREGGVRIHEETGEPGREVEIPSERILRHVLRRNEALTSSQKFEVIPVEEEPPVFASSFYHANIGTPDDIALLELRFEHITPDMAIALLMTNERYPRDLQVMAEQIMQRADERGVIYDAVVAPESLGPKISQEIARIMGPDTVHTTLQKGKLQGEGGEIFIGSPKPWIGHTDGVPVSSGTSHERTSQMLYLDPKIAKVLRDQSRGVLLVDDARLTKGTVDSSLRLLENQEIPVTAVATVLNEAEPVEEIITEHGVIPYIWLTKLPLFQPVRGGMQPIPGTYDGVDVFYREVSLV